MQQGPRSFPLLFTFLQDTKKMFLIHFKTVLALLFVCRICNVLALPIFKREIIQLGSTFEISCSSSGCVINTTGNTPGEEEEEAEEEEEVTEEAGEGEEETEEEDDELSLCLADTDCFDGTCDIDLGVCIVDGIVDQEEGEDCEDDLPLDDPLEEDCDDEIDDEVDDEDDDAI
jgi:hypothetical protein